MCTALPVYHLISTYSAGVMAGTTLFASALEISRNDVIYLGVLSRGKEQVVFVIGFSERRALASSARQSLEFSTMVIPWICERQAHDISFTASADSSVMRSPSSCVLRFIVVPKDEEHVL